MRAVIEQGGKQYMVHEGQVIRVEKVDYAVGSELVMTKAKFAISADGKFVYEGITVKAEVISQERGDKLVVFKKRRRKNYRRKAGHRQFLTILRVKDIVM